MTADSFKVESEATAGSPTEKKTAICLATKSLTMKRQTENSDNESLKCICVEVILLSKNLTAIIPMVNNCKKKSMVQVSIPAAKYLTVRNLTKKL